MNNAYLFILLIYGFLIPVSYRNKNNHTKVVNSCSWLATNTKQRYLYSSQTRRATTFQSCPPGDGKESRQLLLAQRQSARFWTERQFKYPSLSAVFYVSFFFLLTPIMVVKTPLSSAFLLLFFSALLLHCLMYCCTQWWIRGLLMLDGFFYCVLRFTGVHTWYCLLYTSPSPRDKRQSRMPSSA